MPEFQIIDKLVIFKLMWFLFHYYKDFFSEFRIYQWQTPGFSLVGGGDWGTPHELYVPLIT